MLMTEWNWDDALAYRYEEGLVEGEARGREEGEARGREEGREESLEEVALNLVKLGLPIETVITATQLDPEKVKALYQQQ